MTIDFSVFNNMTPIDWSIFSNPENVIFFAILGIIVSLFAVICFSAIRAFFRLIINIFKRIFRKEEDSFCKGVGSNVKELEKIQEEKNEPKTSVSTEIKIPVPNKFSDREVKRVQEQAAKFQAGLQTKIPVAKDSRIQYQGGASAAEPSSPVIKIPVAKDSRIQYQGGASAAEPSSPVIEKSEISGIKHENSAMFGEGKEVSRVNLRQKLGSAEVYRAQKEAGLSLSPIERAKLEKEVFSQTMGRNISKTDLKWGLKKLNQKMVVSKNLAEKGKLRKEIKFFKKIGGIK